MYFGSYVEATKGTQSQTSELTHDVASNDDSETTNDIEFNGDIKSVISKLTQCYNELKNNMQTTISTTVSSVVEEKIKPLKSQVNDIKIEHEKKYDELLKKLNTNTEIGISKYERIIALLEGRAQAPSDATRSPGVGK